VKCKRLHMINNELFAKKVHNIIINITFASSKSMTTIVFYFLNVKGEYSDDVYEEGLLLF